MKGEYVRIFGFIVVGALLMFVLQPWLFENTGMQPELSIQVEIGNPPKISIQNMSIATWLGKFYTPGATIVFAASIFANLIWYVLTAITEDHRGDDVGKWSFIWYFIAIIPILSIFIAVFFFKGVDGAVFPLIIFFIIDVVWLYWLTTATSTPGMLRFTPPLSYQLRSLIGDK